MLWVGSSPTRGSSFFSRKVTALGVLCCFAFVVCLTLLHLSLKHVYTRCSLLLNECSCICTDTDRLLQQSSGAVEHKEQVM